MCYVDTGRGNERERARERERKRERERERERCFFPDDFSTYVQRANLSQLRSDEAIFALRHISTSL